MQGKKKVLIWFFVLMFTAINTGFAQDSYYSKSYALVVGISKYASLRWKNVTNARSDAANVAEVLRKKGFEVLSLYDRDASRLAILARLEKNIAPRLNAEDRFIFYFCGHGYTKKNGNQIQTYLIPYDRENIDENDHLIYISMSDLIRQSKLMEIAKHQLFVIDAPIFADESVESEIIDPSLPEYMDIITSKKARQILTAGTNKQPYDDDKKGTIYNILTRIFIEGLEKGKADINGDGLITLIEMSGYIIPRGTNKFQKVCYGTFPNHDMGEFVFYSPKSIRQQKKAQEKELIVEDLTVKKKEAPIVDIQEGRLYIKAVPKDARVRILNIVPPYRYGMMLKPGNYKIEVSKPGFQTQIKWLAIGKEDQLRETIKLVSNRSYSQLYVNPKPSDAKIRILNIVPKYTPGIALQAGKYLIEISKSGYRTYKEWVKISQYEDLTIEPVLELIQPNVKTFAQLKPVKKESSVEAVKKEISVEDIRNEVVESPKTTPETVQKKEISLSKKAPEQYVYQPKKEDSNLKKLPETNDQQVPEKETFDQKKVESDKKTTETVSQEEQQPALKTESFEKDQWVESITGMKFAWIKGCCYDMGCGSWTAQCDTDETPVHKVCVKGFWMGQYEVTQMEWQTIMENNPSLSAYGNYYPVEKVSWNDVQTYIQKLEKKSGHQFRLPTEAEWEYACRSCGKPQKYSGKGLDLNHIGWFAENSQLITHSVGYKAPNDFDLYDMSGNVAEWCLDSYQDGAYKKHSKNSPVNKNGDEKVVRGGDWSDEYQRLRCSDRRGFHKDMKSSDLGFRLIRIKN